MNRNSVLLLAMVALLGLSCSEINRDPSPVEMVATTTQTLSTIDLAGGEGCDQSLGTITLRAFVKNPDSNTQFLSVNLERMRVSYVRTDGGSLTPAAFSQSIDGFVQVGGGTSTLNNFRIFQQGAFTQAPFAALTPINGGVDPETGRRSVSLDVVVEIFGETLSGEDVSAVTRFPLEFCYNCGGCN